MKVRSDILGSRATGKQSLCRGGPYLSLEGSYARLGGRIPAGADYQKSTGATVDPWGYTVVY